MRKLTLDDFESRVLKIEGCWIWQGPVHHTGYGGFGRSRFAHRYSYETFIGPIPDGLQLDHLCRNRACVRPDHLEPVTMRDNLLRGQGPSALHSRKTHCPKGHAYDLLNTRFEGSSRHCRECEKERGRARTLNAAMDRIRAEAKG